jgi:hypothetical protein
MARIGSFTFWLIALLGGFWGAFTLVMGMTQSGPPRMMTVGATLGIAFAAIPYVVACAWDGIVRTQQKP